MNNIKSITNSSNNITTTTNNISTIAVNTIKNTGRIINTIYNLAYPIYDGVKKGFTEKIQPAKSITSKLPIMNVKQSLKNTIPNPNLPKLNIPKPSFKGGKRTLKRTLKRTQRKMQSNKKTLRKNKIKPQRRTLKRKIKTHRKKSNK